MLKPGGDFVCKYYSGGHDKELEAGLSRGFEKVVKEKPDSSRSVGFYLLRNKTYSLRLRSPGTMILTTLMLVP